MDQAIIRHLPKFKGGFGANPFTHLRDFYLVCCKYKPRGWDEGAFMLPYFYYSLTSYAACWYDSLTFDVRTYSWKWMQQVFLKEFSVKQYPCEPLFQYLERFRYMLQNSPNHGLPEYVLIQSTLDGMLPFEHCVLDILAGGSVLDCTPEHLQYLIDQRAYYTWECTVLRDDKMAAQTEFEEQCITEPNIKEEITCVENEELHDTKELPLESAEILRDRIEEITTYEVLNDVDRESVESVDWEEEESCIQFPESDHEDNEEELNVQDNNVTDLPMLLESAFEDEEKEKDLQPEIVLTKPTDFSKDPYFSVIVLHSPNLKSTQESVQIMNVDEIGSSLYSPRQHGHQLFGWKPGWKSKNDSMYVHHAKEHKPGRIEARDFLSSTLSLNWKNHKRKRYNLNGKSLPSKFRMKERTRCEFGWKPGWELARSPQGVGRNLGGYRAKKFDGVRPWAPNI